MIEDCPDLERFMRGEWEASAFPHREHVRMGFEMLRRHDFAEAVFHYSKTLQAMARRAGKPQAFHQTVTLAFLSLIGERMDFGHYRDFDSFALENADLLDKSALARWYPAERLATDTARRTFLLPAPAR
ncbi:MAG TPA: hypothetical protein VMD06_07275 [Steroidobacteraceae bacterium]|nr:hypothetical protein [Steroidobacteraceae bacterium]